MSQHTPREAASAGLVNDDDEIDLLAFAGALWRGKFTILFAAFIAAMIGAYYAYVVAIPTYRASTSLALQLESSPLSTDIQSILSGVPTESEAMNTELEVIRSRGVIRQLVERLDLTTDPEFNAALRPEPYFSIRDQVAALVNLIFPPDVAPVEPTVGDPDPEITALNRTIAAVRRAVSADIQRGTYIFNIAVTTESPDKSQLIANTLSEVYITNQIDQKFAATEYSVTWLSERVADLEIDLRERENDLKSLRTEIDVVSVEVLEALNRQLIDTRDRANAALTSAAVAEARLSRIEALREAEDYAELNRVFNDPTLSRLVTEDAGSDQIETRIDVLTERAEAEFGRQNQLIETLQAAESRLEQDVAVQSDDIVRLQQIEREVLAIQTLYETFLTRLKEATVQRGLAQPDSRVLSEAIPGTYVSPQKSRIRALSILVGLMAGAAVVLARQFLNRGFRSADELEAFTDQPILGQIPLMPIKHRNQLVPYLNDKSASAGVEAIRSLRTSILLSSPDHPPQVIMVTSSLPGEGKTSLSISLAHNLAGPNKKILLIEGDVRRRTLDEYFRKNTDGTEGIVSALDKVATIEDLSDVISQQPQLGADIILGEKTRQNAPDVFSSDHFKHFLEMLRGHYDYIIIDTPPVLVVPDSRIIGQHVDAILLGVAWDRTSRDQVKEALRQLSGLKVDLGLVLNKISASGMKRYGYGGKYGSYAAYGSAYYDD